MRALIIVLFLSTFNTGCFLKRNVDTETGTEAPPPATDIEDVETGKFVYDPFHVLETLNNEGAPELTEVCDNRRETVKRGPYDIAGGPPLWATKSFDWTGRDNEEQFENADHIHIYSAHVSTASGSAVGSFLSSGYADVGTEGPVIWTPDVDRRDYTIYMEFDGSIDLAELREDDGAVRLSGEARVRYPPMTTYIAPQATFDVWYNCELK